MIQNNRQAAWDKYMTYLTQGGSDTVLNMLKRADIKSPFEEETLKSVCETAKKWLDSFDMTGIE